MTTAAMEPLTEKQAQAFAAIKDGESPSGIAKLMKISPAGAHSHIKALIRKGYINDKLEILYAGPVSVGVLSGEAKVAKPGAKAKPGAAKAKAKPAKRAGAKPRPDAPKPPTFDQIVPPIDISDDSPRSASNGRHPSFEVDEALADNLGKQGALLAQTVEQIETAVVGHRGRISAIIGEVTALEGEKAEHEDAIATLEVRSAAVKAALEDLGAVALA